MNKLSYGGDLAMAVEHPASPGKAEQSGNDRHRASDAKCRGQGAGLDSIWRSGYREEEQDGQAVQEKDDSRYQKNEDKGASGRRDFEDRFVQAITVGGFLRDKGS